MESSDYGLSRHRNAQGYYIAVIVTSALLITYLHYSAVQKHHALHNIFVEFYYFPIVLGAMVFGLKGAILTYRAYA